MEFKSIFFDESNNFCRIDLRDDLYVVKSVCYSILCHSFDWIHGIGSRSNLDSLDICDERRREMDSRMIHMVLKGSPFEINSDCSFRDLMAGVSNRYNNRKE